MRRVVPGDEEGQEQVEEYMDYSFPEAFSSCFHADFGWKGQRRAAEHEDPRDGPALEEAEA